MLFKEYDDMLFKEYDDMQWKEHDDRLLDFTESQNVRYTLLYIST